MILSLCLKRQILPRSIIRFCSIVLKFLNKVDRLIAHFIMLWKISSSYDLLPRQVRKSSAPMANSCDFYEHLAVPPLIWFFFMQFSPKDSPTFR